MSVSSKEKPSLVHDYSMFTRLRYDGGGSSWFNNPLIGTRYLYSAPNVEKAKAEVKMSEYINNVFKPTLANIVDPSLWKKELDVHFQVCEIYNQDTGKNPIIYARSFCSEEYSDAIIATAVKDKKKQDDYRDQYSVTYGIWNSYVALLSKYIGKTLTKEDVIAIDAAVVEIIPLNQKRYTVYSANTKNIQYDDSKEEDNQYNTLYEKVTSSVVYDRGSIDTEDGSLIIENKKVTLRYSYGNTKSKALSRKETLLVSVSMLLGHLFSAKTSDSDSGSSKKFINSVNSKYRKIVDNQLKNRQLTGVIRTLSSKSSVLENFIQNTTDDTVKTSPIKLSDIFKYFTDSSNRSRIIHDMILGSYIKKFEFNKIINHMSYRILSDVDACSVMAQCSDFTKHFNISNNINQETILNNYALYGVNKKNIEGINLNWKEITPLESVLFLLLKPTIVTEGKDRMELFSTGNDDLDGVIRRVKGYFNKQDNNFHRRKCWYYNFSGSTEDLIAYHNKICRPQHKVEPSLCLEHECDLKNTIFLNMFTITSKGNNHG